MNGPPPGWYADPYAPSMMMRFWDGMQWTGQTAPIPTELKAEWGMQVVAAIFAIVMPLVGFILGIVLAVRGKVLPGVGIILMSVVATLSWGAYLGGLT